MKIHLRYFAALREITRLDEEVVELPESTTLDDLFLTLCERYDVERLKPYLRVARNLEFVPWETQLQDGDEVAFIPPVAGGAPRVAVLKDQLDTASVRSLVESPTHGAIVTFEGVVRNHSLNGAVQTLFYEAYEDMALAELGRTVKDGEEKWPVTIAIHHRVGLMDIGDLAVVICVGSAHRKEAFEACSWVIDRLKEVAPIWKKETGPDGSVWVGLGP